MPNNSYKAIEMLKLKYPGSTKVLLGNFTVGFGLKNLSFIEHGLRINIKSVGNYSTYEFL